MATVSTPSDALTNDAEPLAARYLNFRAGLFWLGLAVMATLSFAQSYKSMRGLISAAVAIFCLQTAATAVLGVSLRSGRLRFPRPVFRPLPILSFGRKSVPLDDIKEVTFLGTFLSMQVVSISAGDDNYPLLFPSRESRLAFFESIGAHKPGTRIYRAY